MFTTMILALILSKSFFLLIPAYLMTCRIVSAKLVVSFFHVVSIAKTKVE